MSAAEWQAGIDIGGTFTDLLLMDATTGRFVAHKVLTDHVDPASAVRSTLGGRSELADGWGARLGRVVHATTLVTNAIIERRGAPTALLVTEGFRDVLGIGREHRYDMYDVLLERPEPIVPRRHTFPVPERVLADGTVHRQLDEEAVALLADRLAEMGMVAVAVCLLHAYRYPHHERRVGEILRERQPGIHVALSHEVVGEQREYERASTTAANAYVLEIVDRYLRRIEDDLAESGHRGRLLVMLSSGGVATTETARALPVRLVESGPAAGALTAAYFGRLMGRPDLLSFDMGGTTAKACLIQDGRPSVAAELEVARLHRFKRGSGLPLKSSSVELIEIGAGGGSIARVDRFGLVQVGPDSAGSDPGPACYGRGGSQPTVTDADLLLGYLDPGYFLGGEMELDREAAERAVGEHIARPLRLDVATAAWTVHQLVNENMANATRVHAVERGRDVRDFPVFAFGGAGPVHAYRVAEKLAVPIVICPLRAGVGSTIGLLAAPLAFDLARTAAARVASLDWPAIQRLLAEMEAEGIALLERSGVATGTVSLERAADMRLAGQAHEITVELGSAPLRPGDEARLVAAFETTYSGLFGRVPPDVALEVVSWRVRLAGPTPELPLPAIEAGSSAQQAADAAASMKGERRAYFPELGGYRPTPVYDRYRLRPGMALAGPAIVEERESTVVIGPAGEARVDEMLDLVVTISA